MSEFEFLEKYGHLECTFSNVSDEKLTYENYPNGLSVMGYLTRHTQLNRTVTINRFWQNVEKFTFIRK